MLADYGIVQDTLIVYCDNTSAINISKNLVQHSEPSILIFDIILLENLLKIKLLS